MTKPSRRSKKPRGVAQPSLTHLPDEVLLKIFNYVSFKDLVVLSRVCSTFSRCLEARSPIWQRLYLSYANLPLGRWVSSGSRRRAAMHMWLAQRAEAVESLILDADSHNKDREPSLLLQSHWGGALEVLRNLKHLELGQAHPSLLNSISNCTSLKTLTLSIGLGVSCAESGQVVKAVGQLSTLTQLESLEMKRNLIHASKKNSKRLESGTRPRERVFFFRKDAAGNYALGLVAPPELGCLTNLVHLSLADCILPEAVTSLKGLRHLGLEGYSTFRHTSQLLCFSNLTSLLVGHGWHCNSMDASLDPKLFASSLPKLQKVVVDTVFTDNVLSTAFQCLSHSSSLISLDCGVWNTPSLFSHASSMTNLRELTVSNCRLGPGVTLLKSLTTIVLKDPYKSSCMESRSSDTEQASLACIHKDILQLQQVKLVGPVQVGMYLVGGEHLFCTGRLRSKPYVAVLYSASACNLSVVYSSDMLRVPDEDWAEVVHCIKWLERHLVGYVEPKTVRIGFDDANEAAMLVVKTSSATQCNAVTAGKVFPEGLVTSLRAHFC